MNIEEPSGALEFDKIPSIIDYRVSNNLDCANAKGLVE